MQFFVEGITMNLSVEGITMSFSVEGLAMQQSFVEGISMSYSHRDNNVRPRPKDQGILYLQTNICLILWCWSKGIIEGTTM